MIANEPSNVKLECLLRECDDLREQVRQLKALRATPERRIAHLAPFGIAVVSSFKILYANKACCSMFGLDPESPAHGLDVMSFLDPQEWATAAQLFQNTIPDQLHTPLHLETRGRRQDGSSFSLSFNIVSISWKSRPAFLCYLAETRTKERHELSRLKCLARRRLLRDAAKIFVWDWNLAANTLELDDAILHSLGMEGGDSPRAMFRAMLGAVHQHDRALLRQQLLEGLRCGQVDSDPFRYLDAAGRQHVAVIHAQRVSCDQHQSSGMVGIIRNISEECTASQALLQARNDAQCADLAKRRFISNISHELRTPLNGILGMLQLMGRDPDRTKFGDHLSMAVTSGKNLLQIINDILEISDAEPNAADEEHRVFSPMELILAGCEPFRADASAKGLEMVCSIALPPDAMYRGSAKRLSRSLQSLLANSVKFTRHGSVQVHASIIRSGRLRHRLLLCVEDTGIGIPDSKLTEMFEPFTQADDSPARPFQGAGLGLGLVRNHVARMGGTLSVSSEEGCGTTICMTVDLVPDGTPSRTKTESRTEPCSTKILLAEDNLINQALAETVLRQAGYAVRSVQTGVEVLQALEEEEFGCILMDIQMPEMSGIEATLSIRDSNKNYAAVPIIALTAHNLRGDRERIMASGMDGFIAKPFSITELQKAIAAFLKKGPTASS